MPPRFFLALNNGGDPNLHAMHTKYFQQFLDMERDFKKTPLLEYRHSDDKGETDFSKTAKATVTDNTLKKELKNILSRGFVANYSSTFSHIDLRIKGGTDFTQCAGNGYHPTTVDVPCLLDFSSTQELLPMDDKYFEPQYTSRLSLGQGDGTYRITITDYATYAIVNDIKMFHDFMQLNQQHAQRLNQRGWSHKVDYFKDYYSSKYKNAKFSHPNFPFDIPELYIVTHYFTVLDDVWLGEQNSYYTTRGDYLKFYNKNEDFIYTSELQLKDIYWAKYWWSSAAQCLDRGGHGFDRDFYYYKSSTKYYNCRSNQADKGKHQYYTSQSDVFGPWYQKTMYQSIGKSLKNNVCVYYISSEFPNFESTLMKIAQAVKLSENQESRIFFPNAKLVPNNCYYNVDINNTSTLHTNLVRSAALEIKDSGSADFGR